MENGNYTRISGKKTLILVVILMTLIIILSIYTVFLMIRKSSVLTNSSSYEKPLKEQIIQPSTSIPNAINQDTGIPTRFGD